MKGPNLTLVIIALVTVMSHLVFRVVSLPILEKIQRDNLIEAEQALSEGRIDNAQTIVAQLESLPRTSKEKVEQLKEEISHLSSDLVYARDFYASHGNNRQADLIDTVLKDYETPKEMLEKSQQLLAEGENWYAKQLIDKAKAIAPDYSGYLAMESFVTP